MKHFDEYMKHFSGIDGWFQTPAVAIWDSLLNYQAEKQISGNLLEIGVWKGKSAALAALHCQPGYACVFVDALPLDDAKASISRVVPEVTCHYLREQSQFLANQPFVAQGCGGFRWIHVDGEHSGQSVTNDLEIADHLLSDRGIVVFDDFLSPAYPQVTQAIFQFLTTRPGRLALVLCGFSKGYLCRPKAAREYLQFVRTSLYSDMVERGCDRVTIWKTTEPGDMNTFGISDRFLEFNYRGPDWDENTILI
jgi:hypothetical protein